MSETVDEGSQMQRNLEDSPYLLTLEVALWKWDISSAREALGRIEDAVVSHGHGVDALLISTTLRRRK